MIRRLLTALSLTALVCVFSVRADDEIKGSQPTRKDVRPTREVKGDPKVLIEDSATRQAALRRAFESFRQRLAVMAGRLENGTDKDKEKAKSLKKALRLASDLGTEAKFESLIRELTKKDADKSIDALRQAMKDNADLRKDLQRLIAVLSMDDAQLNRELMEKHARLLERLKDLIAKQERVRAQTEMGRKNFKELEKDQNKVTRETREVADSKKGDQQGNGKEGPKGEAKPDADPGIDGRGKARNDTESKADAKPGEGKDAEGKDGKPGEGKPGEAKEGNPGEGKEGKPAEGKDGKPGEGKPGEAKEGKPGEGKPGEGKPGEGKPGEQKSGEQKPGDKPADPKPAESKGQTEGKGEAKPGQPNDKPDAKPGENQDGSPSSGKPSSGKPSSGKPSGSPPNGAPPEEQQDDNPVRKQIEDANKYQKQAEIDLDKKKKDDATDSMTKALKELEAAKKKLEDLLKQMREEEIERLLADLEKRCRYMLAVQIEIRDGTVVLDKEIQKNAEPRPTLQQAARSNKLADDEDKLVREADMALKLIRNEGSAVAFAEVFEQVRRDMDAVRFRLSKTFVDADTQTTENDIIETLKEMIAALQKAQKEAKQQGKPQKGNSGPQEQRLIDQLAELKMIFSMQKRVNARTETYGKKYTGEQAPRPETAPTSREREHLEMINKELHDLAGRQQKIGKITRDIATGKNEAR
jgi:hypothetical protein